MKRLLQANLPRRAREEVGTPNYVCYALGGIVHHDGKLLGEDSITAANHYIAHRAQLELAAALESVFEPDVMTLVDAEASGSA